MQKIIETLTNYFGIYFKGDIDANKQLEVLLKPIIITQNAYDMFVDLPERDFRFKEKQEYRICRKHIENFYVYIFKPLNDEQKNALNNEMDTAMEIMKKEVELLQQAFEKFMLFVPEKVRSVVARIYTIHCITQCAVKLFTPLQLLNDDLKRFEKHISALQKAYFARAYPYKCQIDPNNEKDIIDSVNVYVDRVLEYEINLNVCKESA